MSLAVVLFICACGADSMPTYDETVPTQTDPYINRIDPVAGGSGDVVKIYGYGFSAAPGNNVVFFGNVPAFASGYSLAVPPTTDNEIEVLTVKLPSGGAGKKVNVYLDVFDNISNTNVTFTLNP